MVDRNGKQVMFQKMTEKQEYPSAIATVDVIPIYYSRETSSYHILLGRKKKHGDKLCFIGGFVDAEKDNNFYDAAARELKEEVPSFKSPFLSYLFSTKVDDPRYRDRAAKIFTSFFLAETKYEPHSAGDDLDEVLWRDLDVLVWNPDMLVEEHGKVIGDLAQEIKWKLNLS